MYYLYILTNWNHHILYVGMTKDLQRRLYEHQHELVDGFTKKYHVHKLVYYEVSNDVRSVIAREKEIKGWKREKKNRLICEKNPQWKDLSNSIAVV